MEFLSNYGLFLAKAITVVAAILFVVVGIIAAGSRGQKTADGAIEVNRINDDYDDLEETLKAAVFTEEEFKQEQKRLKKQHKLDKKKHKNEDEQPKKTRICTGF